MTDTNFDRTMTRLFDRVGMYMLRLQGELVTRNPFTDGTGTFVFERNAGPDKTFTVTARPHDTHQGKVVTDVKGADGKTLSLVFETAADAFRRNDEQPLISVQSALHLVQFLSFQKK